jgi:hypothetical protein
MQAISELEYENYSEYAGLSPFVEEEPEAAEPEELPEHIDRKVYQLAALAVAQLIPKPRPAVTYSEGIGPGLLRQYITRQIENYWREHRRLPSGRFEIEGHKSVQLPEIED